MSSRSERARFFIFDGMSLLFRSFHAMSRAALTTPDGRPIGAVYGFTKVLLKVLKEQNPTHLAVAWESRTPTFRHEMFKEYKANRSPMPEDLRPQIPLLRDLLETFGVTSITAPGFEADDVIGTLAKRMEEIGDVFIVSSDKDFLQFINDRISLYSLKKGDEYELWGRQHVIDYFGVPPEVVIDLQALCGDSVDNVPGVPGIGAKTAAKILTEYGSLDNLYAKIEEVRNPRLRENLRTGRESAMLSRELVTISTKVPLNLSAENLRFSRSRIQGNREILDALNLLGMKSLAREVAQSNSLWPEAVEIKKTDSLETTEVKTTEVKGDVVHTPPWGKRNYRTILTKRELEQTCRRISSPDTKVFSFDTETTGINKIQDKPIGMSLAFDEGEACYIPLHTTHLSGDILGSCLMSEFAQSEAIAKISAAFQERSAIAVAHNLKFDLHMLRNIAIDCGQAPLACSMVAAWLLDSTLPSVSLDSLTHQRLGLTKIPTSQLIGKTAGRGSMLDVPIAEITEYACEDADATLRLWISLDREIEETPDQSALFWDLEMPFLKNVLEMERHGVHINTGQLTVLGREISKLLTEKEQQIYQLSGEYFNIQSPKQLSCILFEKLKIQEQLGFKGKLSKTTLGYKTDVGVLEQFEAHPIVRLVLDFRELSKLLNTYVEALPRLIDPSTERLHTDYLQTGTETGRLSSREPNLQNIPVRSELGKKVRAAFDVSQEDFTLTVADYSQIELRVLAQLSGDENLIEAFLNGADIHRETAAKILGKSASEVTKEERAHAKAINFGIIYGMGPQRLAKSEGISLADAKGFIERYFLSYPQVKSYLDQTRTESHEKGVVSTLFGRQRHMNREGNSRGRFSDNIAINSPIQGTAADIVKLGMIHLGQSLTNEKLDTRMIMQVHDEVVLEGPSSEATRVAELVKVALEHVVDFRVPLRVEIGQGSNWLDAK